jgi:hypothetical protein
MNQFGPEPLIGLVIVTIILGVLLYFDLSREEDDDG